MKKILIANRGEIAIRVMRAALEMGIKTVAVYSEADRTAPHVRYADEALFLGPPPSAQSYLLGDKIIEGALMLGVDGIHPGYGFLSENADFARKVREAGIIFIGPSPESMDMMGSKLAAKETAARYKVPMVPGTAEAIRDVAEAKRIAKEIGFPILIKASAGGGGKGMRLVQRLEDFDEQIRMAQNEARSAFGDDAVFMEKYVTAPRHIEIQILGDQHGNIVYLFERECSIQQRHQKLVEEAPSAILTDALRQRMGESAIAVSKACGYYSAGTVEFLVDNQLNYYFLEMNTRLQVEHPVTEFITGIDLVKEQINIARGEKLSFTQADLKINGHAIELRVCAEDPMNNFLPDIGTLTRYQKPQGPGVRVDDGFEQGMDIPIYYDPMLAKLIVHATTREQAIERMKRAISEYEVSGVNTTLPFGRWVMQHNKFRSGDFDTGFIARYFNADTISWLAEDSTSEVAAAIAAVEALSTATTTLDSASNNSLEHKSKWTQRRSA
ncbi:MAG: acetyl-CoA carboxylase biotin carboxylase subunit [Bacteroidota bacterium]